jgi:mRNA-degrading endonuclease RelE of RelBE toxin-antitoxin system
MEKWRRASLPVMGEPLAARDRPEDAALKQYSVLLKASVAREFEAITSSRDQIRVLWKISSLEDDPRPAESQELPERIDHRRIRLQRYRIIYQIDDARKHVIIFRIVNRRFQDPAW